MKIIKKFSISQILEKNPKCILNVLKGKCYIDPNYLLIDENGIRLNIENNLFKITALYSDNNGIYLSKDEVWPFPFVCQKCGRMNNGFNGVCEYCGTPRDD